MNINAISIDGVETVTVELKGDELQIWLRDGECGMAFIAISGTGNGAPLLYDRTTPEFLKVQAE